MIQVLRKYIFNQDVFFSALGSFFIMAFLQNRVKPDFFHSKFYLKNQLIMDISLYMLFFIMALLISLFFKTEKGNENA
ncbi:hypothetical protein CRG49_005270 [Neisseria sp. N95_16]|nr:hypothetical protein CRG49_005270 [Neisseria sp. N95_16]PJO79038.1 hypothetical protein CWC45_01810 [Neisseria sp. N177_16]